MPREANQFTFNDQVAHRKDRLRKPIGGKSNPNCQFGRELEALATPQTKVFNVCKQMNEIAAHLERNYVNITNSRETTEGRCRKSSQNVLAHEYNEVKDTQSNWKLPKRNCGH